MAPATHLRRFVTGGLLLPPADAPWAWDARNATVTYQVSAVDGSYDALLATLRRRVPSAQPQSQFKDPDALATYYEQSAILRSAIALGFALTLLALVMTLLDLRWLTARSRAAQIALGVPARARHSAGLTQSLLPVLVALLVSVPLTLLVACYFTGYWGPEHILSREVFEMVLALGGVATVISFAAGFVLSAGGLRLTDLLDD